VPYPGWGYCSAGCDMENPGKDCKGGLGCMPTGDTADCF
jgi:hypothetical protein